jgi:GTPase
MSAWEYYTGIKARMKLLSKVIISGISRLENFDIVESADEDVQFISLVGFPEYLCATFRAEVPNAVTITFLTGFRPKFRWLA